MIKYICAWCEKELKIEFDANNLEESISHGICDDCFRQMIAEDAESLVEFLDRIKTPVFIVNDDARILAASSLGQELVGKDIDNIKDHLGGEVFECAYSKLPGGCGKTIHCKSCVIRNTVMDTLDSGEPQYRIPAILNHGEPENINEVEFYISAEKKGDSVFLRIDEVKK